MLTVSIGPDPLCNMLYCDTAAGTSPQSDQADQLMGICIAPSASHGVTHGLQSQTVASPLNQQQLRAVFHDITTAMDSCMRDGASTI